MKILMMMILWLMKMILTWRDVARASKADESNYHSRTMPSSRKYSRCASSSSSDLHLLQVIDKEIKEEKEDTKGYKSNDRVPFDDALDFDKE